MIENGLPHGCISLISHRGRVSPAFRQIGEKGKK